MRAFLDIEATLLPSAKAQAFALPGGELSARLSSNCATCLELAEYFLYPFFISAAAGEPDWEIRAWFIGREVAPLPGARKEGRFMDRPSLIWESPSGERFILEQESGTGFWCRGRIISVFTRDDSPENCRQAARMIREFIAQSAAGRNSLRLHAAAVTNPAGKALLILGTKGAGKTSLMLSLIQGGRAGFCANDRLLVDCENHVPEALGLPNSVRLDLRALVRFPHLNRLPSRRLVSSREGELKVAFPAQELCAALGVEILGRAGIGAVLAPELHPETEKVEISEVPAGERGELLNACLLPADATFLELAKARGGSLPEFSGGGAEHVAKRLIALPWFRIKAAPQHPDLAEEVMRRVKAGLSAKL
jgi:hypothetical protein